MNSNGTTPIPKCLVPDVKATRELAKWVVDERNTMRRQAAQGTTILPLPILNGKETMLDRRSLWIFPYNFLFLLNR
jgi:hypothetical protein